MPSVRPVQPPTADVSLELLLRDEVQQLLDHFAGVMKMQVIFFSARGEVLRRSRGSGNSGYCRLIQEKIFGLERCLERDRLELANCAGQGTLRCYLCHAGLREAIAPVTVNGAVAGFVMLGQFRVSDVIPFAVLEKVPPEHYEALWREFLKLPRIADDELENLLGLFQMLVDYITARELVALSGDRLFERLERYLEKHLTEPVTIKAAARAAGQSVSSLSHKLKARYGASFKTILIEKRLRRAEMLLREHPELSIAEIAAQTGFADRFYFSRIFRKYRGCPPSAYRDGKSAGANGADPSPPWRRCSGQTRNAGE